MSKQGLLLVNLGSPASTAVADVKSYLNQFLMDPYVVDLAWPMRRLLVSLILARRPAESAQAYRQIWWPDGSPLIVLGQRLRDLVRQQWDGPVELGMRYAQPSIEQALLDLVAQNVDEIVLAPLYPQFADSTTTTAIMETRRLMAKHGINIKLKILPPFYADPGYIEALYASAKDALEQDFDHLLLSFHGLPERHLHKTDPTGKHCLSSADCCQQAPEQVLASCYRAQCMRSAELFARRAGLAPQQWSVAFQSRMGRAKWIEPYTEEQLDKLAASGVKKLLVMSPAFVADCVETLEELAIRGQEQFVAAGGESLQLVPCLNDHPAWAATLTGLCQKLG